MRISINNFKAIGSIADYEMRPLTILSGTNSSGKSSFIQLLLLLKQTLELDSAQFPVVLDGDYTRVSHYLDILKGKEKSNKLRVGFILNKSELTGHSGFSLYDVYEDYDLHVTSELDFHDEKVVVIFFEVKLSTNINGRAKEDFLRLKNDRGALSIESRSALFIDGDLLGRLDGAEVKKINYSAFFPASVEIEIAERSTSPRGDEIVDKMNIVIVPKLDSVKKALADWFHRINYIGPARREPEDAYGVHGSLTSVGIGGENVAEVLAQLSKQDVSYFVLEEEDESSRFSLREGEFLNAVKHWLCDRFKLCANIDSRKAGDDSYAIYIESLSGVESTIKHVGFGVSQVLPIIVEGLRLKADETLIVEQPEIHLHPKIQSGLADFFISLIEAGKKVIVETHSDHFITRLRRRIAEDSTNHLDDKVLLTFVEVGDGDVLFRNIGINDYGNLDYFPNDFIEKRDDELKAILSAQMRKRLAGGQS